MQLSQFQGKLNKSRFNLLCSFCKLKTGYCIKCDYPNCEKQFHVRCAIKQNLIVAEEQMSKELRVGEWDCKVYCDKH